MYTLFCVFHFVCVLKPDKYTTVARTLECAKMHKIVRLPPPFSHIVCRYYNKNNFCVCRVLYRPGFPDCVMGWLLLLLLC